MQTATQDEVLSYALQLARCTRSLHEVFVVHRDIKPSNFLFNRVSKKGVLIDLSLCEFHPGAAAFYNGHKDPEKRQLFFRIATLVQRVGKNKLGTDGYMPLEALFKLPNQGFEGDVWAVGVMLLQYFLNCFFYFVSFSFSS